MRKVALALVGTVLGLVLLLSYKSHPSHPAGAVVAAAPSPGGAAPGASGPSPSAPATTTPSTRPTHAAGTPKRSAPATTSRTVTGDTVDTDYGPVQVRITMVGTRMTDVTALQLPSDRSRSREISGFAGPQLRSEALAAQSANIDAVSGASYTSAGYVKSLQSAIDRART